MASCSPLSRQPWRTKSVKPSCGYSTSHPGRKLFHALSSALENFRSHCARSGRSSHRDPRKRFWIARRLIHGFQRAPDNGHCFSTEKAKSPTRDTSRTHGGYGANQGSRVTRWSEQDLCCQSPSTRLGGVLEAALPADQYWCDAAGQAELEQTLPEARTGRGRARPRLEFRHWPASDDSFLFAPACGAAQAGTATIISGSRHGVGDFGHRRRKARLRASGRVGLRP